MYVYILDFSIIFAVFVNSLGLLQKEKQSE